MISILLPHCRIKSLQNGKILPRCERKKVPSDLVTFSLSPLLASVFALLVWFAFLLLVNLVLCIASFKMFFFVFCFFFFQFLFILFFIKKNEIRKIQKQCMFVYIGTCIPWMTIETKFSELCIF